MKWILIICCLNLGLWAQEMNSSTTRAIIDINATKDGKAPLPKSTIVFKTVKGDLFSVVTNDMGQARLSLPKSTQMLIFVKSITGLNEVGQINIPINVSGGRWDVIFNNDEMEIVNVFFDPGEYDLLEGSFDALDAMIQGMLANPQYKFLISGHTDNVGSNKSNLILSENRAKSVVNYLVSKGVSPIRLKAKGYGESRPKASNKTPSGREQNRRIEASPF